MRVEIMINKEQKNQRGDTSGPGKRTLPTLAPPLSKNRYPHPQSQRERA